MVIAYRPHRHLLEDAMKEVKYFSCMSDMIEYVKADWERFYPNIDIVIGEEEIDDNRIGWHHTRYVCIKTDNSEYPQCVGMCDLALFLENKS